MCIRDRLQVVPSLEQGSNPINAEASFVSPWRTAIIGGLDDIVENTMVENLSPDPDPKVQDDYSWVCLLYTSRCV